MWWKFIRLAVVVMPALDHFRKVAEKAVSDSTMNMLDPFLLSNIPSLIPNNP
jgi:hypothetical protein